MKEVNRKKIDRVKYSKKSLYLTLFDKTIEIIFPFLIRSIIIWKLGIEYLGINSLFSNILTVLSISELGFGSAAIYLLYKPIAEQNNEKICALLNYYKKIYKVIGVITLSIGLLIMPFLNYLIKDFYLNEINLYLVFSIFLIDSVSNYFIFPYKTTLLDAHQRIDITIRNKIITKMMMYILQIIIIVFSSNYYLYALMLPLSSIMKNIFDYFSAKKRYPDYEEKGTLDKKSIKDIGNRMTGLLINKINVISRNAFDNIFISSFLGLTYTAIYGNYYYIMSSVNTLIKSVIGSILPSVGNSIETESVDKNYNDMKILEFISMWIIGWFSACLFSLYQPFIKIWLKGKYLLPLSAVVLFVIYFYILNITIINNIYYSALGLWNEGKRRSIIEAICNIVLNFIFVRYFGLQGIIIATIIPMFICQFCIGSKKIFKHYFSNHNTVNYYISHFICFISTVLICAINYLICNLIIDTSIATFALKIIISCIVPNALFFVIYFRTNIFKKSCLWLIQIVRNRT